MSSDSGLPWRYRAVAFDLDGILIDTEPIFSAAVRRFLERRGLAYDAAFMPIMMGAPAAQSLPRFREHFQLSESVESIGVECKQLFFETLGDAPGPLMPGAAELLEQLGRRAIPCAIATSSGPEFVRRVFGPHGLLEFFQFVLTCDDVRRGKPAPEVYELAAQRFGVAVSELIVVEDSPNGLQAAKAAGARCVVVPHPLTPIASLAGADAIVPGLNSVELAAILGH